MRNFLIVCIVLVISALAVLFYVLSTTPTPTPAIEKSEVVNTSKSQEPLVSDDVELPIEDGVNEIITLTPTQRSMAESLGYSIEEIVLTPEVRVCADKAVGAAKVDSYLEGTSPSSFELIKLAKCL